MTNTSSFIHDGMILAVMSVVRAPDGIGIDRAEDGILKYDATLDRWFGYIAGANRLRADVLVWQGTWAELRGGMSAVIAANRTAIRDTF